MQTTFLSLFLGERKLLLLVNVLPVSLPFLVINTSMTLLTFYIHIKVVRTFIANVWRFVCKFSILFLK